MNNGDLKGLIISFTNKVDTDRYSHARHVTVTLGGLNGRKKTGKKVFPKFHRGSEGWKTFETIHKQRLGTSTLNGGHNQE